MEDYHDLRELQQINATQVGFHGAIMGIKIQYKIAKDLDNLAMAITVEKYVLSKMTNTIKKLTGTNKIITEQVETLTKTNAQLIENNGKQQKLSGKETVGND